MSSLFDVPEIGFCVQYSYSGSLSMSSISKVGGSQNGIMRELGFIVYGKELKQLPRVFFVDVVHYCPACSSKLGTHLKL